MSYDGFEGAFAQYQMEVEETSPRDKKGAEKLDYLNQSLDFSTQTSSIPYMNGNFIFKSLGQFEVEPNSAYEIEEFEPRGRNQMMKKLKPAIKQTSSITFMNGDPIFKSLGQFEVEPNSAYEIEEFEPRERNLMVEKLKSAIKTNQICNTFEEEVPEVPESTANSVEQVDEKQDKITEAFNLHEITMTLMDVNVPDYDTTLRNENTNQVVDPNLSALQVSSGKHTTDENFEEHKEHDFNGITPRPDFTSSVQINNGHQEAIFERQNQVKVEDAKLKRLPAFRDHISSITKAVQKYVSSNDEFRPYLREQCEKIQCPVSDVASYLKINVKGRKQGQITSAGTLLQQAKIANEKDLSNLLSGDEQVKWGARAAFKIFLDYGFYEKWVDDQYQRLWAKKKDGENIKKAFLEYKDRVRQTFLRYSEIN